MEKETTIIESIQEVTSADEVIAQLPNKIHSKLLKQGKNLSGGQIQKMLIAKSLLKKKTLLFSGMKLSVILMNKVKIESILIFIRTVNTLKGQC